MKKSFFTILFFAGSTLANAQQFTQANEPDPTDNSQGMYLCDSLTPSLSSITGTNVTWDYSTVVGPGTTKLLNILDAAQTANGSNFPGASTSVDFEGGTNTYISSSVNERISQGFVFNDPNLGDVIVKFSNDPEKLMSYPFAFGSNVTDAFSGTVDFSFNGIPQNSPCTGGAYATIDGTGTLQMDGFSLPSVARYRLVDTVHTSINLLGTIDLDLVREQYEYYALAISDLPVFVHSKIDIYQAGGTMPIASQSIVYSAWQPAQAKTNEMNTSEIKVYPNPATDKLFVEGTSSEELLIMDLSGRLIIKEKGTVQSISLANLNPGNYLVFTRTNSTLSKGTLIQKL